MVSAKFHIIGEDSDWFRVRTQEEIYHHGLEGDVLRADDKNLVVIVEGDKSVIKRFASDMSEACPEGVLCTEVVFGIQRPVKGLTGVHHFRAGVENHEYVIEILKELERRITRIDQNVAKLMALYDGKPRTQDTEPKTEEPETPQDATEGFAAMFGN